MENDWTPYAKPQPDTGQFWLKIQENVCGTVPKVKMHYVPRPLQPLRRRALHGGLPGGHLKREDGLVVIEPEKCTGARA